MFKVLTNDTLFCEFKKLCDLSYYSEVLRKQFKEELKNDNLSDVKRAFYFFYVNRCSHNGVGGFSINRVIRRNMAKSVSDYLSTVDGLLKMHQRLSKVMVLNRNAISLIEEYNSPNVFIYADPPYVLSTRTSSTRLRKRLLLNIPGSWTILLVRVFAIMRRLRSFIVWGIFPLRLFPSLKV